MLWIVFCVLFSMVVSIETNLTKTESKLLHQSYIYSMSLSYLKVSYSELNKLVYISGYITFRPERECRKDMEASSLLCLTSSTSLNPSDFSLYEGEIKNPLNCQRTSYETNVVSSVNPKYIGCAVLSSSRDVRSFNQMLISNRHDGGKHNDDDDDHDFDDYIEVVGYVLGGIAGLALLIGCLIALCCVCICKRRKKVGSVSAMNVEMCGNNSNCVVQGIPVNNYGQPVYYAPPPSAPLIIDGNNNVQPIVYQPQVFQPNEQNNYECQATTV